MRGSISFALISLGLAVALTPQAGRAQSDRDFVFADLEGHLVIRFAGTGAAGLDASQAEEVLNSEFSSMVHDRLRADLLFEDEPRDPEWAASMEPEITAYVRHLGARFSNVLTECRAASCRVVMEQGRHWTVPEHRAVLDTVQKSLEAFVAARPQHFAPVFMLTAYYQEREIPHVKAFLRRVEHQPRPEPGTGARDERE